MQVWTEEGASGPLAPWQRPRATCIAPCAHTASSSPSERAARVEGLGAVSVTGAGVPGAVARRVYRSRPTPRCAWCCC